jgi:hypothetical protein
MEYISNSPRNDNEFSYMALAAIRHTFSIPPVAEKVFKVRKRIFKKLDNWSVNGH